MTSEWRFSAFLLTLGLLCPACAFDPAIRDWSERWQAAERELEVGSAKTAVEALVSLHVDAPTPEDRFRLRLSAARGLEAMGRREASLRLLVRVAKEAPGRPECARALYEAGRFCERHGHLVGAVRFYRAVVRRYPDESAGLRALAQLERLAVQRAGTSIAAHLAWSHGAYREMAQSSLGDNLVFFAARVAYRRWRKGAGEDYRRAAERLLRELDTRHRQDGLWDDALWLLSHLYDHAGDYPHAVEVLRRLLGERESAWLVGSYDSAYYGKGQLRIARMQLMGMDNPLAAAESYQIFINEYPRSRWRDDAAFWRGCAYLRAGRLNKAEEAFKQIPLINPESKYLRRLPKAKTEPNGSVCDPPRFAERVFSLGAP